MTRHIEKRDYVLYGMIPWIVIIYMMVTGLAYQSLLLLIPFLALVFVEGMTMEMWVATYFRRRRN